MAIILGKKKMEEKIDANAEQSCLYLIVHLHKVGFKKDSHALSEIIENGMLEVWLTSAECKAQLEELKERLEKEGYKRNTVFKHLVNLISKISKKE